MEFHWEELNLWLVRDTIVQIFLHNDPRLCQQILTDSLDEKFVDIVCVLRQEQLLRRYEPCNNTNNYMSENCLAVNRNVTNVPILTKKY